jgi:hypothetical protein
MTTRAAVSSGRSLRDSSAETKRDRLGSSTAGASTMVALPPSAGAGSKLAARTVMTFFASLLRTVASALPA